MDAIGSLHKMENDERPYAKLRDAVPQTIGDLFTRKPKYLTRVQTQRDPYEVLCGRNEGHPLLFELS